MDDVVGNVVTALKDAGLWNDTLFVWSSVRQVSFLVHRHVSQTPTIRITEQPLNSVQGRRILTRYGEAITQTVRIVAQNT